MKIDKLTDAHDGEVVVFVLGMQVRRPWRVDHWGSVIHAMTRMMIELETDRHTRRASGYLGGHTLIGGRGPIVTQYWRSVADLEAYAHDPDQQHRPAWLRVYRMAHRAKRQTIGIWHETYVVPAGAHETIYGNCRPIGLGRAAGTVPISARGESTRERLGRAVG